MNPWGPESYAELIIKAIESSPDQRLTLKQIYRQVVNTITNIQDLAI